jgi:hypothetical protein
MRNTLMECESTIIFSRQTEKIFYQKIFLEEIEENSCEKD